MVSLEKYRKLERQIQSPLTSRTLDVPRDLRPEFLRLHRRYTDNIQRVANLNESTLGAAERCLAIDNEDEDTILAGNTMSVINVAFLFAMHAVNEEVTRIKTRFGIEVPDFYTSEEGGIDMGLTLRRKHFGISLREIIAQKKTIARTNPIGVYGFYLTDIGHTAFEENIETDEKDQLVNLTTVGHYALGVSIIYKKDLDEIKQFDSAVTDDVAKPALELQKIFSDARTQVRAIFFNPNHPLFQKLRKLYDDLEKSGEPIQKEMFLSQIIGTGTSFLAYDSYRKLFALISSGQLQEFYIPFKYAIEESYQGALGDELSEAISPREEGHSQYVTPTNETKKLGKAILGATKQQEGTFEVSTEVLSSESKLKPESIKIQYRKHGTGTYVAVFFHLEEQLEGLLKYYLYIDANGNVDWNLLRRPEELPELFQETVLRTNEALRSLHARLTTNKNRGTTTSQVIKQHIKDEVYQLKKEKIIIDEGDDDDQPSNISFVDRSQQRLTASAETVYMRNLDEENPEIAASVRKAINRYNQGYRSVAKLHKHEGEGILLFRLREGNVRIILQHNKENGMLEVISVGDRKDIYKKF